MYSRRGSNEEALEAFTRAEQLDPTDPDAHYRLGRLYMTMGQKEKAAQEFARTKELHKKTEDSLIDKVSGGHADAPAGTRDFDGLQPLSRGEV